MEHVARRKASEPQNAARPVLLVAFGIALGMALGAALAVRLVDGPPERGEELCLVTSEVAA